MALPSPSSSPPARNFEVWLHGASLACLSIRLKELWNLASHGCYPACLPVHLYLIWITDFMELPSLPSSLLPVPNFDYFGFMGLPCLPFNHACKPNLYYYLASWRHSLPVLNFEIWLHGASQPACMDTFRIWHHELPNLPECNPHSWLCFFRGFGVFLSSFRFFLRKFSLASGFREPALRQIWPSFSSNRS